MLLSLGVGPADEPIPGRGLPSGGSEAEEGEDVAVSLGEVSELGSGQLLVSQVVVAIDVLVP